MLRKNSSNCLSDRCAVREQRRKNSWISGSLAASASVACSVSSIAIAASPLPCQSGSWAFVAKRSARAIELGNGVQMPFLAAVGVRICNASSGPLVGRNGRYEQILRHPLMRVISIGTNEIQRSVIAQRGLGRRR